MTFHLGSGAFQSLKNNQPVELYMVAHLHGEVQVSLGYRLRPCLKRKKEKNLIRLEWGELFVTVEGNFLLKKPKQPPTVSQNML